MVWVMVSAGGDSYRNTDHVGINVKRDQQAFLYSCTKDGAPTTALTDLPHYVRPDDPPTRLPGAGNSADRVGHS